MMMHAFYKLANYKLRARIQIDTNALYLHKNVSYTEFNKLLFLEVHAFIL